jgi:hypothetical protein
VKVADHTAGTTALDRGLSGDPDAIAWAVLTTVQADEAEPFALDVSPNEGEPWGVYQPSMAAAADEEGAAG